MADISMSQIESIITALRQEVGGLRNEVGELRSETRTAMSMAASVQTQVTAHVAVCDERQRLTMIRQTERDRWHEEQAAGVRQFMADSAADRARIRESVITAAATAREDLRVWAIRFLSCMAGANIIGAVVIVASLLKFGGAH